MYERVAAEPPEPSWVEILAGLWKRYEVWIDNIVAPAIAAGRQRLDIWAESARPLVEGLARLAVDFREAYDEGVPAVWQRLDTPQLWQVIKLMERTGWCLTATPPSEVLAELVAAEDDERRRALMLANEGRILDDLDRELRGIDSAPLPLVHRGAREAFEAHNSGLFLAAQALSANALAALLEREGPFSMRNLGAARALLSTLDVEEAGLREIRFCAVAAAVHRVLANYRPGDPTPTLFNRHASAHSLNAEQYSQLNSLTAVMLLIGFLREVVWMAKLASEEEW
jgi:hypothetical protein